MQFLNQTINENINNIINKSINKHKIGVKVEIVMKEIIVADNFFTRLKGLLGKDSLPHNQCMLITPCRSIHTFFMKFSIDVVFIDRNYKVVKIIEGMTPGGATPVIKEAWSVIEMPVDSVKEYRIEVGDQLAID